MHTIKDILESKQYKLVTQEGTKGNCFKHVYCCDLLSAVIKHGKDEPILITQINSITTIGVATMIDLPAVILTEGKTFDQETIDQANEHELAILYTTLTSAEVVIDFKNRNLL